VAHKIRAPKRRDWRLTPWKARVHRRGDGLTQADEVRLVEQSRRGDRGAFEELVRYTARLVFARVYLDTGDRQRAEDLVQETYLLAWRRIGTLSDATDFRAWLGAIAHRVVLDAVRREGRQKRAPAMRLVRDEVEQLRDASPPPDEQSAQAEQRQQVLSILRGLPEEYRVPLMLRYLAGADYDAIARQLALSNGSLRGLLQRGMKMLREQMRRFE
jgi:RNA polymerase sigma-70 factor (ECF subfamily)